MFQLRAFTSTTKRVPRRSTAVALVAALALTASISASLPAAAGPPTPTGQEPPLIDKGKLKPDGPPVDDGFTEFCNLDNIFIPSSGPAQPYPSGIYATGLSGSVFEIRVDLRVMSHTYPDDLDVLLVGPTGARSLLMSDAGGSYDLTNDILHFLIGAPALPDNAQIAAGFYSPTDFEAGDTFPASAPAGPYGATLTNFTGTTPNGVWSLYVVDDAVDDSGSIYRGWCVQINTSTGATPTPTGTWRTSTPTNTPTRTLQGPRPGSPPGPIHPHHLPVQQPRQHHAYSNSAMCHPPIHFTFTLDAWYAGA
jgi:hypothetical protein